MTTADIEAQVGQLTLEEKASLCMGSDFWRTAAVERLGIGEIMVSDGPHGLRAQLKGSDHVGLLDSEPATCFPTASGLASSWNRALFEEVGTALGREARALGVTVILGPGFNIKRSPLCGRNFEYLSEDPYLSGALAIPMVEGVQSQGVGTSVKHFAANNQEDDRLRVSAEVDARTLREIYLPAFETVVKNTQPWTVMCAYNKINGTYASEHHWLLTELLRDEWGFEGLVVSDWGAVHNRVAALAGGLDLEMPPNLGVSDKAVVDAVRSGELDEAVLDTAVRRVLRLVEQSQPALADPGTVDFDQHHALARRAARESAVLLKNENAVLPLRPQPGETVAVIGEFARTPRFQGAGSSQVNPTRIDIPVEELRAALGDAAQVTFSPGFGIDSTEDDARLSDEAVEAARTADHVVVFLGLPAAAESEGFDRTHLDLPDNQVALLEALAGVHDRLVVVLANGSVVRKSRWDSHAAAILECWLSGQAAGGAAVDLLTGTANPSGKLAETIPLRLEDNPSFFNFPGDPGIVRYGEGVFVGYRGYDRAKRDVSYPFGFGLSYSTFDLRDLGVDIAGSVAGGDLRVTVRITVVNTGDVAGGEVVQVYVGDREASVSRPVRELKGFDKVFLEPGQSGQVSIELDERAFAFWSERDERWLVESGEFEIAVGSSSRDLPLRSVITVNAPAVQRPLDDDSTLHEWLADERGYALITANGTPPLLEDPMLVKIIGTMPMHTLAAFGMGFDNQQLKGLVAAYKAS
jgi:beta-glucosidase